MSIREIQTNTKTIETSTSELVSAIPNLSTQLALKTFVDNVLASASKIEALSDDLFTTGAIGRFIFFPKLPVELRLEIWSLALPGPRVIEVFQNLEKEYNGERKSEIKVNNPPLTLFHVNREAREVASNKYMRLSNVSSSSLDFCRARFDPNKDTIFIPWSGSWSWSADRDGFRGGLIHGDAWSSEARTKVQYLAMDYKMWGRQTWESGGVIPVLPSYNPPGYYPGLFYMGRGRIRVIVG